MEISDAARAVTELYRFSDLHEGECRVVNVASEDTRTLREFVEEIQNLRRKGKSGVRYFCAGKGRRSVDLPCGSAAEGADRGDLAGAGFL